IGKVGEELHAQRALDAVRFQNPADPKIRLGLGRHTISTITRSWFFKAAARTTARMASMLRPPRPMTLPTSSLASVTSTRLVRALLQPGLDLFLVDVELDGVGHRVEGAKDLDELTVAWRARIGHHQSIERVFFRPDASQSNFYGQAKTSFNFSRAVRDRWAIP